MLYISQIKRLYKNRCNERLDNDDIPDIAKSIEAVVDIIQKIKPDIIAKSWSKSGLVGSGIDHVSEVDEFSTKFEAQLNLNDDQSLENDILPIEETPAIEEIPSEEADSEPIEKKN